MIGYKKEYSNDLYCNLSKNIVVSFLRENGIKKYKFLEIKETQYQNIDILISDIEIQQSDIFEKEMFREAIYFLTEDSYVKEFNYPEDLYKLKVGIVIDSLAFNYFNTNFKNSENLSIYNETKGLIEDFNNRKIDVIVIDRTDYYKNLFILPKKYLFFVETGNEFGYIYFKNREYSKLFDLFIESNNIVEKEWLKFVL